MKRLLIPIVASASALIGAGLLSSTTATARDCTIDNKCADISISGHAEPQPIRRGQRTTLKITAKNNGPGELLRGLGPGDGAEAAQGQAQVDLRRRQGLRLQRQRLRLRQVLHGRPRQGGAVRRQDPVKAKKKGTYVIPANAYADGSTNDPNGGNNQVSITVGVQGRHGRHGHHRH